MDRARLRCECLGRCRRHKDRCRGTEPYEHPGEPGLKVKLAIVFLDYNERNWSYANLGALCQPCRKAHAEAKPKPQELLPEYGGLFDAAPVQKKQGGLTL